MRDVPCPNNPAAAGVDEAACPGWVVHRSQPIPCHWCWSTAGYPPLNRQQRTTLRRYHVLLTILAAATLLDDVDDAGRQFDDTCAQLRDLSITDDLRDRWVTWLDQAGAPPLAVPA